MKDAGAHRGEVSITQGIAGNVFPLDYSGSSSINTNDVLPTHMNEAQNISE